MREIPENEAARLHALVWSWLQGGDEPRLDALAAQFRPAGPSRAEPYGPFRDSTSTVAEPIPSGRLLTYDSHAAPTFLRGRPTTVAFA